eukprot:gene3199-4006_t
MTSVHNNVVGSGGGRNRYKKSSSQTTTNNNNNNSNSINNNNDKNKVDPNWALDLLNFNDELSPSKHLLNNQQQQPQPTTAQQQPKLYNLFDKRTILYCTLVFISVLFIYAITQNPSVTGGDAGELIINAYQLGVAHPPGYPLFTMLGYIFSHHIPFLNQFSIAGRVAFMSSLIGALCSVFIFLSVYLWTNCELSGFVSSYLFTFSPLIWMYQIQGEVFSLNNMFTALIIFMGVWYSRVKIWENQRFNSSFWTTERIAYMSAFVCGLGLTNQHTLILIVVPFAFWLMFIAGRDQLWTLNHITSLFYASLLGLSPYLYLFLIPKFHHVVYSWGHTETISGFITHFLRKEYGTLQLYSGDSGSSTLVNRILLYFENLFEQFNVIGVLLACVDQSENYSFHDFGHYILKSLPRNTIFLVGGDLVTNVPQYLHLCEDIRPDVDIISLEIMSWDWFTITQGPLYNRVNFPGNVYHPYKEGGFSLKQFLDANQHRPIFIGGDFKHGDNSFQKDYFTVGLTLSSQIFPNSKRSQINPFQMINRAFEQYPNISLPNDTIKYPADSWEYFMINDYLVNLEKSAETLLSWYIQDESENGNNGLQLAVKILEKVVGVREKCWSLKHLGVCYDHLRYRVSKFIKPGENLHQKIEEYGKKFLASWSLYVEKCYSERDNDWDTIKSVVKRQK